MSSKEIIIELNRTEFQELIEKPRINNHVTYGQL